MDVIGNPHNRLSFSSAIVAGGTIDQNESSRLPGFYELSTMERSTIVSKFAELNEEEEKHLHHFGSMQSSLVDVFIENAVGTVALPLGIATNFLINKRNYLVPMAVEESSVLAAASHGAKLARDGGGFFTSSTDPIMTGQIQLYVQDKPDVIDNKMNEHRATIIEFANKGQDRLLKRGGGVKDLSWEYIREIESLVIYLHVDTRDAMGANIVNTMCEKSSNLLTEIFPGCGVGLRILTNLNDRRLARAECEIPFSAFDGRDGSGEEVVQGIEKAYLFAKYNVYRATTNNKGVMNGIDPVVIATGNDWRAIEAGAHAYMAREGTYRPMAEWKVLSNGNLYGSIELPMALGTVGGVTKLHPVAQTALKILGSPSARQLSEVAVAVGLSQNLSALRALATEGIQKGHMSLHRHNIELMRQGATKA